MSDGGWYTQVPAEPGYTARGVGVAAGREIRLNPTSCGSWVYLIKRSVGRSDDARQREDIGHAYGARLEYRRPDGVRGLLCRGHSDDGLRGQNGARVHIYIL